MKFVQYPHMNNSIFKLLFRLHEKEEAIWNREKSTIIKLSIFFDNEQEKEELIIHTANIYIFFFCLPNHIFIFIKHNLGWQRVNKTTEHTAGK